MDPTTKKSAEEKDSQIGLSLKRLESSFDIHGDTEPFIAEAINLREKLLSHSCKKEEIILLIECDELLCSFYYYANKLYMYTPYLKHIKDNISFLLKESLSKEDKREVIKLLEVLNSLYGQRNDLRNVAYCCNLIASLSEDNDVLDIKRAILARCEESASWCLIPSKEKNALSEEELVNHFGEDNRALVERAYKRSRKKLKRDPVEQDERYLAIYDQAEKEIQQIIEKEGRLKKTPNQYWNVKAKVMKKYGIDWSSPQDLNQKVRFD